MGIVLSGGPLINATFTGATKQNIIDGIEAQLLAAGWSTVSGHNTTNLLMQTATTAGTGQGLSGRFRFKDNAGNCVNISCESSNGSRVQPNDTTNGGHLLPATGKQIRVIANPYQFFAFGANPWAGREFVCGGVPYIPSNLQGIVWEAIWLQGNGITDANGSNMGSFRILLYSNQGNWQAICNGAVAGVSNNTGFCCTVPVREGSSRVGQL